jgi:hypothetical protein
MWCGIALRVRVTSLAKFSPEIVSAGHLRDAISAMMTKFLVQS